VNVLHELADRISDIIVAAWVDARTGIVIEHHTPPSPTGAHGADFVGSVLDAAGEVMRLRERPPRMVLLAARHVHIVQRTAHDPSRVLVVVCERSANLGMAVSLVRSLVDRAAESGAA
jgi:hypothetical protein